jgi:predicted nucleotidyltransferase
MITTEELSQLTDRVINGQVSVFELGDTKTRQVLVEIVRRLQRQNKRR